jgi:hypothetical protein
MSKTEEVIMAEREAIKSFLCRWAKGENQRAAALRSDTSQNEPEARCADAKASALEQAGQVIVEGKHWR